MEKHPVGIEAGAHPCMKRVSSSTMRMMQQSRRQYTVEDYFSLQRGVELKLEYLDGEIYVMAGGSANHNRISRNVLGSVSSQLADSDCEAFGSDMRVMTPSGLYTYPDVSIVWGEPVSGATETISNPVVLVEVLSDSTRRYDQGKKFELYGSIATLKHYVLIEPDSVHVEHRHRQEDGSWSSEIDTELGRSVTLSAAGVGLTLAQIYTGVEL